MGREKKVYEPCNKFEAHGNQLEVLIFAACTRWTIKLATYSQRCLGGKAHGEKPIFDETDMPTLAVLSNFSAVMISFCTDLVAVAVSAMMGTEGS